MYIVYRLKERQIGRERELDERKKEKDISKSFVTMISNLLACSSMKTVHNLQLILKKRERGLTLKLEED